MARIVPLFSGSKGNCYYIGTAARGVLIDAGRNCKQIELAMDANGLSMKSVGAVFVTHEHIDHCSGLKVLTKKYNLPVYASEGTLNALAERDKLAPNTKISEIKNEIAVADMRIQRFDTPHDAAESCCYRVTSPDGKIAMVATDIGHVTEQIRSALADCHLVVLESNHDVEMLKASDRPPHLVQRIAGRHGHLSNYAAGDLLASVADERLRFVLPAHLSGDCNRPELAEAAFRSALRALHLERRVEIVPTFRDAPSRLLTL